MYSNRLGHNLTNQSGGRGLEREWFLKPTILEKITDAGIYIMWCFLILDGCKLIVGTLQDKIRNLQSLNKI